MSSVGVGGSNRIYSWERADEEGEIWTTSGMLLVSSMETNPGTNENGLLHYK